MLAEAGEAIPRSSAIGLFSGLVALGLALLTAVWRFGALTGKLTQTVEALVTELRGVKEEVREDVTKLRDTVIGVGERLARAEDMRDDVRSLQETTRHLGERVASIESRAEISERLTLPSK